MSWVKDGIVEGRYDESSKRRRSRSLGTFSKEARNWLKRWCIPSPPCSPRRPRATPNVLMHGTVWASSRCSFGVIVLFCRTTTSVLTPCMNIAIFTCKFSRLELCTLLHEANIDRQEAYCVNSIAYLLSNERTASTVLCCCCVRTVGLPPGMSSSRTTATGAATICDTTGCKALLTWLPINAPCCQ